MSGISNGSLNPGGGTSRISDEQLAALVKRAEEDWAKQHEIDRQKELEVKAAQEAKEEANAAWVARMKALMEEHQRKQNQPEVDRVNALWRKNTSS